MNWILNLFKSSDKANDSHFQQLFVENESPVKELNIYKEPESLVKSPLESFLNENHLQNGYSDGYLYHSSEMKEATIRSMKASFCELIDRTITLFENEYNSLNVHLSEISDLGNEYNKPIEDKLALINDRIQRLLNEKDLSHMLEGLIQKPLHQYIEGYLKGVKAYQQEKILNSSYNLFND